MTTNENDLRRLAEQMAASRIPETKQAGQAIRALLDELRDGRIREDAYRTGAEIYERRVAALEEGLRDARLVIKQLLPYGIVVQQARALLAPAALPAEVEK